MPQKYAVKDYAPEAYYHVYARGNSKQPVFIDPSDYKYFLGLFSRYLSNKSSISKTGAPYPNYRDDIELLAYCLMRNHFHMLIYQRHSDDLRKIMHSLMTSYSRYFNVKYARSGAVFESRYKARLIFDQSYLEHISRYIHLNPRNWATYRHSSLANYLSGASPDWLIPNKILVLFASSKQYKEFVQDYEDVKKMFDDLKHQLADQ